MPDMFDMSDRALVAKNYVNSTLRFVEAVTAAQHDETDIDEVVILGAKSSSARRVAQQLNSKLDCLHGEVAVEMAQDRLAGIFDAIANVEGPRV